MILVPVKFQKMRPKSMVLSMSNLIFAHSQITFVFPTSFQQLSNDASFKLTANVHGELGESEIIPDIFAYVDEKHESVVEDGTKDARVLLSLTPNKASSNMVVSDNKENNAKTPKCNIEKRVKELQQFSVRKLTKMVKEKLSIVNNSSQNENDNEAPRQALRLLPENQKA